jgi:hypothetical protein
VTEHIGTVARQRRGVVQQLRCFGCRYTYTYAIMRVNMGGRIIEMVYNRSRSNGLLERLFLFFLFLLQVNSRGSSLSRSKGYWAPKEWSFNFLLRIAKELLELSLYDQLHMAAL